MANDFKVVRKRNGVYNEFSVVGLKDFERELERMDSELRSNVAKKIAVESVEPMKRRVITNINLKDIIDTTALKESVRVSSGFNRYTKGVQADVRAGVDRRGYYKSKRKGFGRKPFYAMQIEYGTSKANPFGATEERPFMRPAFDGYERQLANHAQKKIHNRIMIYKLKRTKGHS